MHLRELLVSVTLLVAGCPARPLPVEAAPEPGLTASAPIPAAASTGANLDAGGGLALLPAPPVDVSSAAAVAPPPELPGGWFVLAKDEGESGSCHFGGVVQSLETTAVTLDPGRKTQLRAVRITFADGATACRDTELTGVRTSSRGDGPRAVRWRERPCSQIVLGVPRGWTLPFSQGAAVCGSVRRYTLGYDAGDEVVVLDARGGLLLAFAAEMPRTPAPLPGWSFTLGPERETHRGDEGYALLDHDVVIAHGAARRTVRPHAPPAQLDDMGEPSFRVEANGYRISGLLPVWMKWLLDSGYGFAVAREGAP
jgi:hypothetical protein